TPRYRRRVGHQFWTRGSGGARAARPCTVRSTRLATLFATLPVTLPVTLGATLVTVSVPVPSASGAETETETEAVNELELELKLVQGPAGVAASTRLSHARVVSYPMAQVWPTALRYLRVDRGYALVDRDAEAGYVLFDFPIGDGSLSAREDESVRVGRGSLELVATVDASGRPSVKVQVS